MTHHMTVEEAESKKVSQKREEQMIEEGKKAERAAAKAAEKTEPRAGGKATVQSGGPTEYQKRGNE
jgi:hypothetical protein